MREWSAKPESQVEKPLKEPQSSFGSIQAKGEVED